MRSFLSEPGLVIKMKETTYVNKLSLPINQTNEVKSRPEVLGPGDLQDQGEHHALAVVSHSTEFEMFASPS